MKYKNIFRFLGMIIVLTLLLAAFPATALAATLTLSPAQAKVGDTVNYTVAGYGTSANDYYIDVYISDQSATSGSINTTITRFKRVRYGDGPLDDGDSFTGSFVVPAIIDEGSLGALTPHTVIGGGTYYIYTTARYAYSQAQNPPTLISSYGAITISPSASLDALNPATGPAGTTVSISGGNFPASTPLAFLLDTTTVLTPTGDTSTRTSGIFISTVTIPTGTAAGAHTISVTAGSSTATATFTVTAAASIDTFTPTSGAAGSLVTITGSNFLVSTPIVFKFDTSVITPNSGAQTGAGGTIASVITIPASAAAGAHTVSVTVGAVTVSKEFTVTAVAVNPAINLSATSGAAGSDVTIGGTDFPSGNIAITFDGAGLAIKSGSTQASGGVFSSVVTVPSAASAGAHTIAATVGSTTKSAQFTVTAPTPTSTPTPSKTSINVVQNGNFIGATIGIGGAGFTAGANVTIKYDDVQVASVKVDANTTFISPFFEVPVSKSGEHTITVSDGVNSAKTTFTVESVAPKVPPPLKPELGAKVKSPVVFDWQEVTDESKPVTYRLQVATDKSFSSNTVVLDKTGIEGSSYTLSEIEELKLASKNTPYYWRVKAIDAASNESEWTGAGEFYVSGPFKFPTWGIYTAVGVGAVVLFLLGLWVGRRTAFYY